MVEYPRGVLRGIGPVPEMYSRVKCCMGRQENKNKDVSDWEWMMQSLADRQASKIDPDNNTICSKMKGYFRYYIGGKKQSSKEEPK